MKYPSVFLILTMMALCPVWAIHDVHGAELSSGASTGASYQLVTAVMCEDIVNFKPVNPTVVFSLSREKGICFTHFEQIKEKTFIYHKWYRRDLLSSVRQLFLEPPSWRTFSSIQFRQSDKGPWRVEITDSHGNVLKTLRFSVTD